MHDVIICDEEFESAASVVQRACSKIEQLVSLYLRIMENACNNGVVSGETAEALKVYVGYAERLKDVTDLIAEHHSLVNQYFLDAVDTADNYLY